MNNTCSDETTTCASDADCTVIGNGKCGFAGHRDWHIPNVKELQSIVDYSRSNPATSVPGVNVTSVGVCDYWSVTTSAFGDAWGVNFYYGEVIQLAKLDHFCARAVRP